jgi:hypothetical protein
MQQTIYILNYIWLCAIVKIFWQQVMVSLVEAFKISVELIIQNTVFTTNTEEFPLRLPTSYYFLLRIISTAVNGQIICQPLKF